MLIHIAHSNFHFSMTTFHRFIISVQIFRARDSLSGLATFIQIPGVHVASDLGVCSGTSPGYKCDGIAAVSEMSAK